MKLTVLIFILLFALGLFILAAILKEDKKFGYALLSGFVMILTAGLLVAGFGIDYQTGSTITDNGSTIEVVDNYTSLTNFEGAFVALPLIITGFWGLMIAIAGIRESRFEADDE
jgi:ABC-type antimicrobial peptide transport system permease subunit